MLTVSSYRRSSILPRWMRARLSAWVAGCSIMREKLRAANESGFSEPWRSPIQIHSVVLSRLLDHDPGTAAAWGSLALIVRGA